MRYRTQLLTLGGLLLAAPLATGQPPAGGDRRPAPRSSAATDPVARMMAFDANNDGVLTKAEVTDARLHRLFLESAAGHVATVLGSASHEEE